MLEKKDLRIKELNDDLSDNHDKIDSLEIQIRSTVEVKRISFLKQIIGLKKLILALKFRYLSYKTCFQKSPKVKVHTYLFYVFESLSFGLNISLNYVHINLITLLLFLSHAWPSRNYNYKLI